MNQNDSCDAKQCGCESTLPRRDFLKLSGAASAGSLVGAQALSVMAGPFEGENEYLLAISADKKLDPQWVASLFARGEKETYSDPAALRHIGMPVGGLFAGTVYLSGDGRLWLWDIFNRDQVGISPRPLEHLGKPVIAQHGTNYIQPAPSQSPFELGFSLRVEGTTRSLDLDGFSDVTFDGRYPMGRVSYREASLPLQVELEAFSPFIPLNVDDSSLPATIMHYTVKNTSDQSIKVELLGHLQNPICRETRENVTGALRNRVVKGEQEKNDVLALECFAESTDEAGAKKLSEQRDFGTMTLALLSTVEGDHATADRTAAKPLDNAKAELDEPLIGELGRTITLAHGQTASVTFLVTWRFPNFSGNGVSKKRVGHAYASRFDSASDVARYVAENFERLADTTRLWVDTWYDSTLPFWFLDRTMANTSTLATTTCYRFEDGRFWAWEGVGCCEGTCTHVWHYAQALGRLFPQIERNQREQIDFGMAQHKDGGIGMRAWLKHANEPADDGQCGRILGAYREHQMSADDAFLNRVWPRVRKAIEYMIAKDGNADGMIEISQPNTLDASWFGKVSFLASLYLAALKAGEAMANELGDAEFAETCKTISARGAQSILETFDGEYFTQIEDPAHLESIGVGPGCYIDQVFGQTWAHWLGLGRLFDRNKQLSALRALWRYNFVPDIGPFRETFPRGRWYAMAGDAGLVMCTWPKETQNPNFKNHRFYEYFNECMSGFEWQAASHMIAEGIDQPDLLQNGLAISRAIHDRYNARLRNPYNEVECSDHYARAMASYGAFLSACGYEYHGPQGHLAFTPRLTPENFQCAFTTAEGWGSYHQQHSDKQQRHTITLKWGQLRLSSLAFSLPPETKPTTVSVRLAKQSIDTKFAILDGKITLSLATDTIVRAGESIEVVLS